VSGPRFAAIVLAAGASTRMGGPNKLLTLYRGHPLGSWAGEAARNANVHERVIVTGRDGDDVARACGAGLSRAHNARFHEGLASSLRLGLAAAHECDAVAILYANMPEIDAALVDLLFAAWTEDAYAIAPMCEAEGGHPIILCAPALKDAETLSGDVGAEVLLATNSNVIHVNTPSRGIFKSVERPTDFDL